MDMSPARRHQRLFAGLALAILLLAAVVPALSHALGRSSGHAQVEVCTAQGMRWVDIGERGPADSQADPGHLLEHCPFCRVHAPVLGLPPTDLTLALPSGPRDALPRAYLLAPRRLHAWVSAPARAPPPLA